MTTIRKQTLITDRYIYIGPPLSRARLAKYQVFIGGLPTHLDDVFAKCPAVKKLFVPLSDLIKAEQEVKQAGTPLNKYYKLAKEA